MVRGSGVVFLRYPVGVRRSAFRSGITCLVLTISFCTMAPLATADWTVRRSGSEALVVQTARALASRPNDASLAVRLVKLANKPTLERLLDDFRRRAEARPPSYPALSAYAQLLLAAHRPQEAASVFARAEAERATSGTPDAAPILGQAAALRSMGDRAGAVAAFQRALAEEARPARRRHLLEAMVTLMGDPDQIDQELAARRELLALDPSNDAAALRLVDVLERRGRSDEAARILEERLSSDSSKRKGWKVDIALRAAALHESAGADERAASILADLLEALPPSAVDRRREVWDRAIAVARHQGRLAELAERLEHPKHRPRPVEWEELSEVRDELGDLEGALDAAQRASQADRRNLDLGRRIVALLDRLGREDDVTAELERLARLAPGEPRFAIDLVERQFRRARKQDARALFDRALTRFARNAPALARLAELAGRWSEDQRAMEAWTRLRHVSPRDEMAILGLGEGLFQRRKKDLAIRTWQALREGRVSKAEGHARLAEVLMDHDLLAEATAEAQQARALEPREPRHLRTMAQILERQRKPDAAIEAWEKVLEMSAGPTRVAERREARTRMLALVSREGRARLDAKVRKLRAELHQSPDDREAAMFLAEAELRNGDTAGAIATLRATVERDRTLPPGSTLASDDAKADAILSLVRLLRQTRQPDEAVRRLDELAKRIPNRAREAHIQIADIELGRYDDHQALDHAERAARLAPDNGQALVRIAEVQERAGEIESALGSYRRAFARDSSPAAAFALSRLLIRRGSPREAAEILRTVLRSANDEETIGEAGRRAIDLEEYLGTLGDLERVVSGLIFSAQNGLAYRRLLVDVYRRLLPTLYRAPQDAAAAAEERARMAQHGLRPLLELLTDSEGDPERGLVELLGMLGNRDAAPALARLAQGLSSPVTDSVLKMVPTPNNNEVQVAAIIALGRLSDPRGRTVLEALLASPDASVRGAATWALGRVTAPDGGELLARSADAHLDVAVLACLGLGRTHDPRWESRLAKSAADPAAPPRQRRGATIALGLLGDRSAVPTLLGLLDSGDDDLAWAAATALGTIRDPTVLPALAERVLLQPATNLTGDGPAAAALDRYIGGAPLDEEAKAIDGSRIDVDAMLGVLTSPPSPTDRTGSWIGRTRDIGQILNGALGRSRDSKLRALNALDARDDGPGLGRLAPAGSTELAPPVAVALREIGAQVRDAVLTLLDDPTPEVRASALRVAVKLGDSRVSPGRIVATLTSAPAEMIEAASFATAWKVKAEPKSARAFVDAIRPLMSAADSWEHRLAAIELLRHLSGAGRASLEGAVGDENPFVRSAAVEALAGSEASLPFLLTAAADPVAAVRAAAARALASHPGPATRASLARLARDSSPLVREATPHIEP
jgi:tetratricopeptide (TPR) repeat protein/HEAT repeat protein